MRRGRAQRRRAQAAHTIGYGDETDARSKEAKKTARCRPRRALVPPGLAPRQADEADIFPTVRRSAANRPLRRRNVSKTKRAGAAGVSHAELAPSGLVVRNLPDADRSGQATAAAISSDLQFHDAGNRVVGNLKYSSKIGHRALFPIVISRNILRAHPFLVPMRGCLDASVTVRPFPRLFYGRGHRARAPARPSLLIQNQNNFDRTRLFP
ncbi:hypothetical protein [Burkholderia ubonensis]|uniref:hypothetical protein n=1 Tax=Burkholderia ubonensis TaxID=101571 RepID=UPI000B0C0670|nr:hypothetical protein [Burkholderia ubonensis]